MVHERITIRADQLAGVPCIRGLRIPVSRVVAMVANGLSAEKILQDYPDLEAADIPAALKYPADWPRQQDRGPIDLCVERKPFCDQSSGTADYKRRKPPQKTIPPLAPPFEGGE